MTRIAIFSGILLLALAATACNYVQPRIVESSDIILDQSVDTTPLAVYVRPAAPPPRPLSALYLPFTVEEVMDHPRLIGTDTMRHFWQSWAALQVFPTQEFDPGIYFYHREQAVNEARERGADLVIAGDVGFYLHGGTRSDTSISLRIDIYDAASGQLIWSMAEAGRMEYVMDEDYILFTRNYRLPQDPMSTIITRIANEMAIEVRGWSRMAGTGPTPAPTPTTPVDWRPKPDAGSRPAVSQAPAGVPAAPAIKPLALESAPAPMLTPMPGSAMTIAVDFDSGSAAITPASYPALDKLGGTISSPSFAGSRFIIRGHTDSQDGENTNLKLSLARAQAVKDYLIKKTGLAADRISVQGLGEYAPIADNETPEGRRLNRRVEIVVAEGA